MRQKTAETSHMTTPPKLTILSDFMRTILGDKLRALSWDQLKKERYYHIMICIEQYSALCVGSK
jgi:hypothetical protein